MAPDVIAGNMKFCDFGISHYFNAVMNWPCTLCRIQIIILQY